MIRGAGRLHTRMDERAAFSTPGGDAVRDGRQLFENDGGMPDEALAGITTLPGVWAPSNPHYMKTHVNAPGTVRQWFRQMRAADFERDLYSALARDGVGGVDLYMLTNPERAAWTLFDTQKVVDRETAAHYLGLDAGFTLFGFPVVFVDEIERSVYPVYPQFRSTVATGPGRGITREDLQRFMDDEYVRFLGRALDEESPLR